MLGCPNFTKFSVHITFGSLMTMCTNLNANYSTNSQTQYHTGVVINIQCVRQDCHAASMYTTATNWALKVKATSAIYDCLVSILHYYYYNHLTASFPGQPG